MFPEPTELLLVGCLIESIWTPKSKSNRLTPKTNSQTCWQREISHVMNGIIFCVCLSLAIFSSTNCSEVMSKRTPKDSGEERVTAKSKPMMNLVSRCSERTPDVLPSTASESPGKTRHESQSPLSLQTEKYDRTERPVVYAHSSRYSEWNIDKTWSFQEWKSDELMEDRTGRPVVTAQHTDRFIVENDKMNFCIEAESELSLESRTFLHRENDQVRKRQNQSSKDATNGQRQTFCDMGNVNVFDIASICVHGEELLRKLTLYQKYREQSHVETDVWHIWKIENRTIRRDLWNEHN